MGPRTARFLSDFMGNFRSTVMEPIRRVKKRDPILMMLVGNKCDKVQQREVSREEGAALAQQFGCNFLETSAKTGQNVEDMFTDLVRALR